MSFRSKKRRKRKFLAYGSLDKKARHWQYLPQVKQSTGSLPRGEELVYRMNANMLEVGQGASFFRGYAGLAMGLGVVGMVFGAFVSIPLFLDGRYGFFEGNWLLDFSMLLVGVVSIPMFLFAFSVFLNDFFGYIDAPVRFDRERRKVYVWNSRKEGPIELDWDRIKPVAQAVSAPPYQVNAFRSVLLVDEDEDGEVRFEGLFPRIAQIGAAVLHREHTLAAYEYVRTFMERGPQALPPVKEHLVFRHHGVRPFVDLWGVLQGFLRSYPSLPKEERSPGWLAFGIVLVAVFSCTMLPFQLAQGIAMYTTRVPKWPEKYAALAASGGELKPPPGAVPNTPPMLPHEKAIATLWVASALAEYLWFYFALFA